MLDKRQGNFDFRVTPSPPPPWKTIYRQISFHRDKSHSTVKPDDLYRYYFAASINSRANTAETCQTHAKEQNSARAGETETVHFYSSASFLRYRSLIIRYGARKRERKKRRRTEKRGIGKGSSCAAEKK